MDEFAIGADFERATPRGNEGERRDALSEFENFGRQTDGLWCVVSDYAVFDRNFCLHSGSFPIKRVRNAQEAVKGHREVDAASSLVCLGKAAGSRFYLKPEPNGAPAAYSVMNMIAAAARSSPELKIFFSVVLLLLLTSAICMFRNRKKFFCPTADPGDTYASANLRMWMVILILIHAIIITTIMIFEV